MKVLLTGATGQLGLQILAKKPKYIELIIPDKSDLDLSNENDCFNVINRYKPKWVINSAAYTKVDKAEEEHNIAYSVNSRGPISLAKAIKANGGKLLHLSTDYVFDGNQNYPYKTSQLSKPLGIYGKSKSSGESGVLEILEGTSQILILRTSWLMGPKGHNFALTMLELHKKGNPISVVSDQIGSPTSAIQLADSCWKLINLYEKNSSTRQKSSSILHWCNSGIASWYDIAIAIGEISLEIGLIHKKAKVIPISSSKYPSPAPRPKFSVLDCNESYKLLKVDPIHWREALFEILKECQKGN